MCCANCCILYRQKVSQEGPQLWYGSLHLRRLCTSQCTCICLKLCRQTCKLLLSGLTLSVKKRVMPLMLSQVSILGNPAPERFSLHLYLSTHIISRTLHPVQNFCGPKHPITSHTCIRVSQLFSAAVTPGVSSLPPPSPALHGVSSVVCSF